MKEEYPQFNEEWEEQQERKQETTWHTHVARIGVVLLLIVSMLWLSGGYQYFFYSPTPESLRQEPIPAAIDAQTLVVPARIFIVRAPGSAGSEHTEGDARRVVENADNILSQAALEIDMLSVTEVVAEGDVVERLIRAPSVVGQSFEGWDPRVINIIFIGHLYGINGVSFGGLNTVAVADRPAGLDFRTLAHEIGHALGLGHVSDTRRLMAEGAEGTGLTLEEITIVRNRAERFK